jgi:cell division protein FtsB
MSSSSSNEEYESYFSVLRKLKDEIDQPLEGMRDNYQALSITKKGFWGLLIFRTLLGFKEYKAPKAEDTNKIVALMSNAYTALSAVVGSVVFTGLVHPFGLQWNSLLTYSPAVLLIALSLYSNLSRMITIGDAFFHIGAYSTFRKKEYRMFLTYLNSPTFSFSGLNEWIAREILNVQLERSKLIEILERTNDSLENDKQDLSQEITDLKEKLIDSSQRNQELTHLAQGLINTAKQMNRGYNRAIDILWWLRDPPQLKKENLALLSDYSVFRLRRNKYLDRLDELGTTATPSSIDIHNSTYAHYSSVKVIKNQSQMEFSESDREGRLIASYRFIMPNKSIWVYNFHYYDPELRDIIGTQQFYRLVNIMLILLQERNMLREDDQYAQK